MAMWQLTSKRSCPGAGIFGPAAAAGFSKFWAPAPQKTLAPGQLYLKVAVESMMHQMRFKIRSV